MLLKRVPKGEIIEITKGLLFAVTAVALAVMIDIFVATSHRE
jgi:hypothetical protein